MTINAGGVFTLSQAAGVHTNSGTITANGTLAVANNESFANTGTINAPTGNVQITNTATGTFTTSGTLTMGSGQTMFVTSGNLAYTAGSFVIGATLNLNSVTATFTPSMTFGTDGPSALTLSGTTVNAPALTNPVGLTQSWSNSTINAPVDNSGTLTLSGSVALNGALTANAGSVLRLTSANVTVANGFTNNGLIDYASGTAELTITSGTLVNAVGGTIDVPGNSRFLTAPLDNRGTVTVNAGIAFTVSGQLTVPSSASATFDGGGTLTVTGVDLDGATFDNVRLITTNGTIGAFDNVTFQNMDATATQLTINHPGAPSAFTFDFPTFSTTPTTGLFISANDNAVDANTLTINLTNSTPSDGTTFEQEVGGAIINWSGIPLTWVNAAGGNWNTGANWDTGVAPTASDHVLIDLDGTYAVTVDAASTARSLSVGAATGTQTLTFAGFTLTVTGDFATVSGGTMSMAGPAHALTIGGNATFGGLSTDGLLTEGVVTIGGDFSQTGGAGNAYRTTGTHRTVLNGTAPQSVNFDNPASSFVGSQFQDLEINGSGNVTLLTTINITDSLLVVNPITLTANTSIFMGQTGALRMPAGSSLIVSSELRIPSILDVNGSYSVGTTIFQGTGQTIPANLPYTNLTVFGNSASFGAGTPTITGDLLVGRLNNFFIGNLTLNGTTTVTGDVRITSSSGFTTNLTVNGQTLNVGTDLQTQATGVFTMDNSADLVDVAGNVLFQGGDTGDRLTGGILRIAGNFTQSITATAFQPSATHRVVFDGTDGGVQQVVSFSNPSRSTGSFFNDVEIANTGIGVRLNTNAVADGQLIVDGASTPILVGNGRTLTTSGVDVDGLVMSRVIFTSDGTITGFDNVTFQSYLNSDTQLTINHPGEPTSFVFDGLSFLVAPTTGFYIAANDTAADGNTLTIDLTNASPLDGSARTSTSGGAVVTWPDALQTPGPMVFTSFSSGNNDIWIRSAGGTLLTQLTTPTEQDWDPEWSPDGTQIVFSSFRNQTNDHVWVMNADGTGQTALTTNGVQNVYASWSPDGTEIVFSSGSGTGRNIWTMDSDGTNLSQLTSSGAEDSQANWSPDGTDIVFFSARSGLWQIWVMDSDGSNEIRLTNNSANDFFPVWSPDGSQIAFISDRDGNTEVYVMNANGSSQTRLTTNGATDIQPSWTPDGSQILFNTDRDGNQEIYIMDANGSNLVRLTNIAGPDQFPHVRPSG